MKKQISIQAGSVELTAELKENHQTAEAIWNALPLTGAANTWGKEIYFAVPVHLEPEDGREPVDMGDLGCRPDGNAFCIFFGPTPIPSDQGIRPAGPVSVFGNIMENPRALEAIMDGEAVKVTKKT